MAKNNIKSFYDTEIAMLEHEFLEDNDFLDCDGENMRFYFAGVHDFAHKVIQKIREKEEF